MEYLNKILQEFKNGKLSEEQVKKQLESMTVEDLDFAKIDHSRSKRQGFPEVIFCSGKTEQQIIEIAKKNCKKK